MKILIVDDSKLMRNAIRKQVTELIPNVACEEAGDGVEGLKALKAGGYDVALVDWNMPNKTGIEMVREVRAFDRKTILIMVTTEAEKARVVEAIKAGVNNYVVKPFDTMQLVGKIQETVAKQQQAVAA
jgi:two-component system, chemotaxis family, chemotaxis protein CheY